MSALAKMNGNRAQVSSASVSYSDLRDKVASLVRPDRAAWAGQPRPAAETAALASPGKADRSESPRQDLDGALDILGRATSCFDLLVQKLNQIEGERDDAFAQIEEHKRSASTWQEMIETSQSRMRDAERDMTSMRDEIAAQQDRAEAAESRAAQLEDLLKNKERRLDEVEQSYLSLHKQVISSFGFDSPNFRALEALVNRFQLRAA